MCNCTGQLARGRPAPGAVPVLGEGGMLLMEAAAGMPAHIGPVTGAVYPFDERRRMWVDRRDAVYILGPGLRLAA